MKEYVDSCLTLEILKQDSGLAPKPKPEWNTFVPKEGDLAHVDEDDSDYLFTNGEWVKQPKEENENWGTKTIDGTLNVTDEVEPV